MKLQTKLTLFLPSKRVQRRHYTLHRCASSFASIDDIASEMHRRGWVDRGPVKSRTPPTFKKCFGCGARDKTKKNFARNQWLREEPRCRSCTKTSEDLEFDRVVVRREAARKAALAAFVPPQPRAIVQGVVLPLPKPDKPGIHPELATEEPAAAPVELAAAPRGNQPPKSMKEFGTFSSRAKCKREANKKLKKRFLQQLASLFFKVQHAVWQPGFLRQKMLYNVLWWLRRHHLPPEFWMGGGQPCRSPRQDELWVPAYGRVLEVSSQMGISVHDSPHFSHSRFRTDACDTWVDTISKGTRLVVQEAQLGWIRVTYAGCAQHALWVRFTSQQQYNSNYSPYGEFFNGFANCTQEL